MKKNILKIGILIITMFLSITTVNAASYSVNVSTTNTTKGSKIKLTIRGSSVTGRFNISTSNSSVVSISEDRAWIENNSYTITLSALNTGSATITVNPSGVSDSNGNALSLSSKSIKINVSLPREKSSDNNLKSLKIEGYDISPSFDKNVQTYSAIVPENTKNITIKASANSSYATVRGTGTKELAEGTNSFSVIVRSETGSEKIYTINVSVKDEKPITVTVNNEEYTVVKVKENLTKPNAFEETTVKIEDYDIPAFINELADITLVGLKNNEGTISLFVYKDGEYTNFNEMTLNTYDLIPVPFDKELDLTKTSITINDEEVEAYKLNENTRYVIINAKNLETGEPSLYLYDAKDNTAVLYDDNLITVKSVENDNETIKNYTYIIIAFAGALVLELIVIMSLMHSIKKKQKKINKFVQKQEAKIEATRKLNDVVEEVQKITELENKEQPTKKTKKKSKKEENVEVKEIQTSDPNNEIKKVLDENDEVYNLFEDDKKKKKKKK